MAHATIGYTITITMEAGTAERGAEVTKFAEQFKATLIGAEYREVEMTVEKT